MLKTVLPIIILIASGYALSTMDPDIETDISQPPRLETLYDEESIFDDNESDFLCAFENELLSRQRQLHIPGLAVAIVKNGKVIYQKGFGYRDLENEYPVTTSTVFRIGSVSKGLSAGLAGIMEEKSFFNWNDPISFYIPNYTGSNLQYVERLTIERILSHTTGYPYQAYSTLIEDGQPRDKMLEELQLLDFSRKPGDIHAYQNVAYSLIEKVIEAADSGSFKEQMKKKLFDPLNMQTASLDFETISSQENVALPHFATGKGYMTGEISPTYYNASAAGGINASIKDMSEWLKAIMGYRPDVLPYDVRMDLVTPKIETAVKNSYLSFMETPRFGYYGLGWRIIEYPSDTLIYHEGYVNGYKSGIAFSQTNDLGICILTNTGHIFSSKLLADFFKMYREREVGSPKSEVGN